MTTPVPHPAAHHTGRRAVLQVMTLAFMGALVMIGLALWFVLDTPAEMSQTDLVVALVQVGAGLAVHAALPLTYRTVRPIPPGTPRGQAHRSALGAFQTSVLLRLALSEAIAIASLAAAFALPDGNLLTYGTGAVVSLVLMAWHAWPSERSVERFRERLDGQGGRSHLRELMGLDPWSGAPDERP